MGIYKAESRYVRKNMIVRAFMIISVIVGVFVILFAAGPVRREFETVEFFSGACIGCIIMAFITPFQYSGYLCSNFENGSIKNIIASGHSRGSFLLVKFLRQAASAVKCMLCYILGTAVTFVILFVFIRRDTALIGFESYFMVDMALKYLMVCIMLIYFCALILFISVICTKESLSSLFTLLIIVVDITATIRLSQTDDYAWLRDNLYLYKTVMFLEEYSFINSTNSFLSATIIPLVFTAVLIALSVVVFRKKDISV